MYITLQYSEIELARGHINLCTLLCSIHLEIENCACHVMALHQCERYFLLLFF